MSNRPTTDPTVARIAGHDDDNRTLWEAYNVGTPDDIWAGTGRNHLFVTHFGRSHVFDFWLAEFPATTHITLHGIQPVPGTGLELPRRESRDTASDHPLS